jgi:hypothetical protein
MRFLAAVARIRRFFSRELRAVVDDANEVGKKHWPYGH